MRNKTGNEENQIGIQINKDEYCLKGGIDHTEIEVQDGSKIEEVTQEDTKNTSSESNDECIPKIETTSEGGEFLSNCVFSCVQNLYDKILINNLLQNDWNIIQLDTSTAFLNGLLGSEIYIYTPEGSECKTPILKLNRAIYSLKESPKKIKIRKLRRCSYAEWETVSGCMILFGSNQISCLSKNHTCVALSSAESEYVEAAISAQDLMHLEGIFKVSRLKI
ncbi:hypothetical protein WA026_019682, partial [Henosepilachna vigintioctopunctata]